MKLNILQKRLNGIYILLALIPFVLAMGCATEIPQRPPVPKKSPFLGHGQPKTSKWPPKAQLPPLGQLKPIVAAQDKMPFDSKVYSLSARSAPLQDVLMGLAKEARLNLVIEKGVDPLEPVSVEINNLNLRKALDLLFAAYDYFYVIDGNNLMVKATETRFFKFEFPAFNLTGQSSGSGGQTAGTESGFTLTSDMDDDAANAWEQIDKALSADEGLLSEDGKARIDRMSGTIIVKDRRENLDLIEEYLVKVEKAVRRQVVIEARIVEVRLTDDFQYGIDWTYFSGDVTFTSLFNSGSAQVIGFTPTDGDGSSWFLDALSRQGEVNVLSSPRINVMNNQSAVLNVGSNIPYLEWTVECSTVEGETGTVCNTVPTVSEAQEGVSLGLTPQIGEDGIVTLHIVPVINDYVGDVAFTLAGGTNFTVPVIDSRSTDTIVQTPDGGTVVIAGLMREENNETVSGLPLLKDIPLMGGLFSNNVKSKTKSELVIALTANIVNP